MPIAFDVSAGSAITGTSVSISHTMSSSPNGLMLVGFMMYNSSTPGTVQYAGVNMDLLGSVSARGTVTGVWMYGLLNPPTGANNILVNTGGAGGMRVISASYTGVRQSGLPDAVGSNSGTAGGNDLSGTVTTIADNAWVAEVNYMNATGTVTVAGADVARGTLENVHIFMDSGSAVTPPAAKVITGTVSGGTWNTEAGLVIASFAPAEERGLDLTSKMW